MIYNKKIIHIVATGLDGEIGKDNKLLWHIPEDLKFFKEKTIGHVCIAGRKTVESFPKPLSRRIVLPVGKIRKGYDNVLDALGAANHFSNTLYTDEIYIIGGQSIYEQTKDLVDIAYITKVHSNFEADTFYKIPKQLQLKEQSETKECNGLNYTFEVWSK